MNRPYDESDRLFDPAQGGGALLDLGVYVVSFAQYFLGTPDRLEVTGSLAPTGVDWEVGLLLGYDDGRAATLLGSLRHHTPGSARIFGTEGWIEIPPRFHHPDRIVLHRSRRRARGADPSAAGRRLLPRAGRGQRVPARGPYGALGDAAGRHPRRAADPERGLGAPRRLPPGGRRRRGLRRLLR